MVELLTELSARPDEFRLSLVTGNLEPIARLKLERAGVGRFFAAGQGGFGSDHEDRGRLPAIARARASDPPWPRERTVVIGDTPRDIACARADGVRVAAVATGPVRGHRAGRRGRRRRRRPRAAAGPQRLALDRAAAVDAQHDRRAVAWPRALAHPGHVDGVDADRGRGQRVGHARGRALPTAAC